MSELLELYGETKLFTLTDMLLYLMIQFLWIWLSILFVKWIVRKKCGKLCWDCVLKDMPLENCPKAANKIPCSKKEMPKIYERQIPNTAGRIAGIIVLLVAIFMLLCTFCRIGYFYKNYVSMEFIMQTLPSTWLHISLTILAVVVTAFCIKKILPDICWIYHFLKRIIRK